MAGDGVRSPPLKIFNNGLLQGPPEGGGWGAEPSTPHLLTIHICGLPLGLLKEKGPHYLGLLGLPTFTGVSGTPKCHMIRPTTRLQSQGWDQRFEHAACIMRHDSCPPKIVHFQHSRRSLMMHIRIDGPIRVT